jgi:hypothetical protein
MFLLTAMLDPPLRVGERVWMRDAVAEVGPDGAVVGGGGETGGERGVPLSDGDGAVVGGWGEGEDWWRRKRVCCCHLCSC